MKRSTSKVDFFFLSLIFIPSLFFQSQKSGTCWQPRKVRLATLRPVTYKKKFEFDFGLLDFRKPPSCTKKVDFFNFNHPSSFSHELLLNSGIFYHPSSLSSLHRPKKCKKKILEFQKSVSKPLTWLFEVVSRFPIFATEKREKEWKWEREKERVDFRVDFFICVRWFFCHFSQKSTFFCLWRA